MTKFNLLGEKVSRSGKFMTFPGRFAPRNVICEAEIKVPHLMDLNTLEGFTKKALKRGRESERKTSLNCDAPCKNVTAFYYQKG